MKKFIAASAAALLATVAIAPAPASAQVAEEGSILGALSTTQIILGLIILTGVVGAIVASEDDGPASR